MCVIWFIFWDLIIVWVFSGRLFNYFIVVEVIRSFGVESVMILFLVLEDMVNFFLGMDVFSMF